MQKSDSQNLQGVGFTEIKIFSVYSNYQKNGHDF